LIETQRDLVVHILQLGHIALLNAVLRGLYAPHRVLEEELLEESAEEGRDLVRHRLTTVCNQAQHPGVFGLLRRLSVEHNGTCSEAAEELEPLDINQVPVVYLFFANVRQLFSKLSTLFFVKVRSVVYNLVVAT